MSTMIKPRVTQDQRGIVSILVTMIIMIVLTLIVTGFAQLARREQRAALDNQLNTQAFYAAESGVNDARRARTDGFNGEKTTCPADPASPFVSLRNNNVSADGLIQYSCLLIKSRLPYTLHQVSTDSSRIVPMNTYSSAGALTNVGSLEFEWTGNSGSALPSSAPNSLPPQSGWGGSNRIGMLRVDVIPVPGSISGGNLSAGMMTFFAYPQGAAASGQVAYGAGNGSIVSASCDSATGQCKATLTGLGAAGTSKFYVRIKALYTSITVKTTAIDVGGNSLLIEGAQAEIDSTGKANDVLKRIKVRVDDGSETSGMDNFPEYPLETKNDICKKLEVWPGGVTNTSLTACSIATTP